MTRRGDIEWLVEAKTVGASASHAVREAIGQLLEYRHFYYTLPAQPPPKLLAVFNGPIGGAYEQLLAPANIEVVISDSGNWRCSSGAAELLPQQDVVAL